MKDSVRASQDSVSSLSTRDGGSEIIHPGNSDILISRSTAECDTGFEGLWVMRAHDTPLRLLTHPPPLFSLLVPQICHFLSEDVYVPDKQLIEGGIS